MLPRTLVAILVALVSAVKAVPLEIPQDHLTGRRLLRFTRTPSVDSTDLISCLENWQDNLLAVDVWGVSGQTLDIWLRDPSATLGDVALRSCLDDKVASWTWVDGAKFAVQAEDEKKRLDSYAALQSLTKVEPALDPNWHKEYHTLNEINSFYYSLAEAKPEVFKRVDVVGKSWEGREILAFRFAAGEVRSDRPQIFWQANIHAREWITSALLQYITQKLVLGYGQDPEATYLLDNLEFVIVPVVNVDGFSYTKTNDRMWRKNRRPETNGQVYGVDLNRNYDDHYGGPGSSSSKTSENYRGPNVNSEPEVAALSKYILEQVPNLVGGIDWHSYGQLILRPYAWAKDPSPTDSLHIQLGAKIKELIYSVSKFDYTNQRWIDMYAASGVASDFFNNDIVLRTRGRVYGRAFGFTIEVRPTGSNPGFILPPDQIIPTSQELTPGVFYFARFCLENTPRISEDSSILHQQD